MNRELNKKVSIIIPTYNEEKYLPLCLSSIVKLNYPKNNVEIIVVDNGSKDRTLEIAEKYSVKLLKNEHKNVSGLRNYGVSESSGEIIAFVDADCIVSEEWLNNASIYFNDLSIAAWGSPPAIPEEPTWVQKTWFLIRQKHNEVQDAEWLETMNLFVRKNQFESVGGLDESLVTCEDVDLSYKLKKIGRIVSDSRIEVVHLGEAATVREFIKKEIWRGQGNLKGVKIHGFVFKELPSLLIPLYFGLLFIIVLIVFIFSFNPNVLITGVLLYTLPSLAVFKKIKGKKVRIVDILRILLLIQVYFFSRTIAVVIKT